MSTLAAALPLPATCFVPPAAPRARHLPPHAGDAMRVLGDTVTTKVPSRLTEGAYALFELACPPGSGVPLHADAEDETFYLLEGALTFVLDGATFEAEAGSCVFVPRGTAHRYANRSDATARALVTVSPGATKERLFGALSALGRMCGPGDGAVPAAAVAAACAAHGVTLLDAPSA